MPMDQYIVSLLRYLLYNGYKTSAEITAALGINSGVVDAIIETLLSTGVLKFVDRVRQDALPAYGWVLIHGQSLSSTIDPARMQLALRNIYWIGVCSGNYVYMLVRLDGLQNNGNFVEIANDIGLVFPLHANILKNCMSGIAIEFFPEHSDFLVHVIEINIPKGTLIDETRQDIEKSLDPWSIATLVFENIPCVIIAFVLTENTAELAKIYDSLKKIGNTSRIRENLLFYNIYLAPDSNSDRCFFLA
jgi:hypothetical protein